MFEILGCCYLLFIYLVLITGLGAFIIYKEDKSTKEDMIHLFFSHACFSFVFCILVSVFCCIGYSL